MIPYLKEIVGYHVNSVLVKEKCIFSITSVICKMLYISD